MRDDDQELITRFRYLTGKRSLGGFCSLVDKDFDEWIGGRAYNLLERIHSQGFIGGGSLGDEYRPPWFTSAYYVRPGSRPPPVPMWWDQTDDPSLTLIEDRTPKPKSRFYKPAYWPGVFGEKPKKPRKRRKKKPVLVPALPKPKPETRPPWQRDARPDHVIGFRCEKCMLVLNTQERYFDNALSRAEARGWHIGFNNVSFCRDCMEGMNGTPNSDRR